MKRPIFLLFSVIGALSAIACGGKTTALEPASDAITDVSIEASGDAPGDDVRPPIDFARCSGVGSCILAAPGCCGAGCGRPKLSDFEAIEKGQADAFRSATCHEPAPPCPGCASRPDPNLQAACLAGRCAAIDIRVDAMSSCSSDADCTLRYAMCCQPCAATADYLLVAINPAKDADFRDAVCVGGLTPCPHCVATYPASEKATCDPTTHHCLVTPPIP